MPVCEGNTLCFSPTFVCCSKSIVLQRSGWGSDVQLFGEFSCFFVVKMARLSYNELVQSKMTSREKHWNNLNHCFDVPHVGVRKEEYISVSTH